MMNRTILFSICLLLILENAHGLLYHDEDCDPEADFEDSTKNCASGRGLKCNRRSKKCYCLASKSLWDPEVDVIAEMQPDWIVKTGEDIKKKGACKGTEGALCSTILNDCQKGLICIMPNQGDPSTCVHPSSQLP